VHSSDSSFVGSIPETYHRFLGPALFEPYAADLAERLRARAKRRVLEVAAGTGIVTRALRHALPPTVDIVATDLNAAMLEVARAGPALENVRWEVADAAALPFSDAAFDTLVCQFGVMFFPDKAGCAREARRVLAPGGTFALNVWGALAENPVGATVVEVAHATFPDDPPRFLERGPYGYHDLDAIETLLRDAGFGDVRTATVDARCRSPRAEDLARGLCEGSPLLAEITARDPQGAAPFRLAVTRALEARFGSGPVDAPMRAHVVVAS
jgi:SAM-dependent methyltransferase